MALNSVNIQMRIPFDIEVKNEEDDKRAFLSTQFSVQRSYKPEGEQYYPEDLIPVKAFGAKAKFIGRNFKKGDMVLISGELMRDDDYEKDGQTFKGGVYVRVSEVNFCGGGSRKNSDAQDEAPKAAAKPAAKASTPSVSSTNPFKGKGGFPRK